MNRKDTFAPVKVGILGGGQLGQMLLQAGIPFGIEFHVLDPDPDCSCSSICSQFQVGQFKDADTVFEFGKDLNIVTIEIEHVSVEGLKRLEAAGVQVYPPAHVVALIQDKTLQKQFYRDHSLPTSAFQLVENQQEFRQKVSLPAVFKSAKGGYDGRGVKVVRDFADLPGEDLFPGLAEDLVDIEKEIAVLVARNPKGELASFPLVEMIFNPEANLVEQLVSPANVDERTAQQAKQLAEQLATASGMVGILAVEFFVDKNGNVLINEAAPRPHNSGHHTIKANAISQYEQHLRAILGLPLGNTHAFCPAGMLNILGEKEAFGPARFEGVDQLLTISGAFVHLYGKKEVKPFRKMGHITLLANSLEELKEKTVQVKHLIKATT